MPSLRRIWRVRLHATNATLSPSNEDPGIVLEGGLSGIEFEARDVPADHDDHDDDDVPTAL